ncbi:MAG: phosphoribosylglycinamide formyltransferase [Kordiimonadaceae bacterium]|jgi:phosphoribosylglycinamide formyltransferase 1|nr:phosphoribosylglycinamide formyltransferase [Kordiimonadaceae bacterium]MBT6036342.1 phosphoribosylglycinamide formyltransferase [Kordiimonadaceae bacterium]MBT6330834.1 phosphoribosylglycinamide formyltransferase [Kordiimonadaceae bacterium]MBT7581863.1 phosphoribosylglycinamide formyltransferase [Kordiimonadaceae bacterium]
MIDIAVLISGGGTNLQALIDACARDDFPARIALVISNNPGVKGLERAEKAGIATTVINHRDFETREAFDDQLHEALNDCGAKLICLAGFMRILDARFVNRWRNRMINIHPSLLPSFKGLHTQERALEAGVCFSGCTVHFVNPELDDGPIITQAALAINPSETADELAARVLELEHIIYPQALRLVAEGRVRVVGNKVTISGAEYSDQKIINPVPE